MTIHYEITVISTEDQDILYRAHGTRHEDNIPHIIMDQLGKRYMDCTVIFHNLTEGWKAEKDYH